LKEKLLEFKEYIKKIEYINSAINVLYWDMRVGIPSKGIPYRGEVLGYLSGESYKLQTSDTMKGFIEYFQDLENLDEVTESMVQRAKKDYDQTKKIPEKRYVEYTVLVSKAEAAWEEAKNKSDFNIFKPFLQEIVDFNKEFIGYWGYKENKYNTLLDFYEPGITVEKLDKVFGGLRVAVVELLNKIKKSDVKPDGSIFTTGFSKEKQETFGVFVLNKMEYDFKAGRLDESVHPFTIEFCNKDVRITTHYHEKDLKSALFGSIHEGGHALYEQDIPDSLQGTRLGQGVSMGIHESQSRFYENILGRSKPFWKYFYPELKKTFSEFNQVSLEDFYVSMNEVKPSLIRIEADELTYSLHIIIRYEIEKALINGEIEVEDLPEVWNSKYKEYLGVEPNNDSEGVLQDMHWSGGSFGYFPSYALGNLYGAQFLTKILKDIPSFYKEIEAGNLSNIHVWLRENIHKYGSIYTPSELIRMVTGEDLNEKYFIEYLNEKYSKIYKLK